MSPPSGRWRALGVGLLTLMMAASVAAVAWGTMALSAANDRLVQSTLDNVGFLADQFEVEYLQLMLTVARLDDGLATPAEAEQRRDILISRIDVLRSGDSRRAFAAHPDVFDILQSIESELESADFTVEGVARDRARAMLEASRPNIGRVRAAAVDAYNTMLLRNREDARRALTAFGLSLLILTVVTLAALYSFVTAVIRERAHALQREADRLKAQQQATVAQLLEDVSDLLLRYGADGEIRFAKGIDREGSAFDFFLSSGRSTCLEMLGRLSAESPGLTHEVEDVPGPDGRPRIERWSHRLVAGLDGRPDGFVSTAQDLTELRALNAQLIQSSKLAALGEISAGIAHELMQPLNALRLGIANLRRQMSAPGRNPTIGEAAAPPEQLQRLERMEKQVGRAGDIVHTMRMLGRQSELKLSGVPLADVLTEVVQLFDRPLAAQGIALAFSPPPGDVAVVAHPQFLIQVLINLISNARDALEDKDGPRNITLGAGRGEDGLVEIMVEDDGSGIAAPLMERLLEPFFTTKPPGKGMGLGLALSHRLVVLFGGSLNFGNRASGGAWFRVSLKAAPLPPPDAASSREAVRAATSPD